MNDTKPQAVDFKNVESRSWELTPQLKHLLCKPRDWNSDPRSQVGPGPYGTLLVIPALEDGDSILRVSSLPRLTSW